MAVMNLKRGRRSTMKRSLPGSATAGLAGLLLLVGGCASGGARSEAALAALQDETPIAAAQAILVVHGMSCPLCANNVDKQLLDVPGVTAVQVDMSNGQVAVALAAGAGVSRKQLADAVHRSGFTLAEVHVP
jgi:copper chaperone CopZ